MERKDKDNSWVSVGRVSKPDSYDGLEVLEQILTADGYSIKRLQVVAKADGLNHEYRTAAIEKLVELQGPDCRNLLESLTRSRSRAKKFVPEDVENDEGEVRMAAYEWLWTGLCGPVDPKWEEQARQDPYQRITKWL